MEFAELIKTPRVDGVILHRPFMPTVEGTLCLTGHHLILSSRQDNTEELWLLHSNIDCIEKRWFTSCQPMWGSLTFFFLASLLFRNGYPLSHCSVISYDKEVDFTQRGNVAQWICIVWLLNETHSENRGGSLWRLFGEFVLSSEERGHGFQVSLFAVS